jgi:TolB-like protein
VSRLKRLIHEIHRRSLWQVLGIYLGGAWVALQGVEALVSVLGLPEWVPGFALVVLILGLPIVMATAFVQEGIGGQERPAEAAAGSEAEGVTAPTDEAGLHLVLTWPNVILGGVAILALAGIGVAGWLLLGGDFSRSPETIRSIAVLPLENLSGDPEQDYFADGMTEALIGDLAKLGSLNVISRTSVMQYKNQRKPLPEIARELNVDGIIEGTVMRAGDRVRITAQLIDARSDRHLWNDRYDRELSDVLALQAGVARAVADQIRLELSPGEQAALTPSRTVDPKAYDAYLRGLQLRGLPRLVRSWGLPAIEQFERAVKLDPHFAEAWVELARARAILGNAGRNLRYRSQFPKAQEAVHRALEIDDRLGGAHALLGGIRLWYEWDFPGARRPFERALQLGPSDPGALNHYALYLLMVGRTEEALDLSERLLRVAPLDLFWRGRRIGHFYFARQYERAIEEFERAQELDPGFVEGGVWYSYLALGQFEEAHRAYIAFDEQCGAPCDWSREAQERGWAEGGWEGSLRAWLDAATKIEGHSPFFIGLRCALIGDADEAFTWLERGYRERDPQMIVLKAHPAFDPLRSDPRFDDLLRRIGFPEE